MTFNLHDEAKTYAKSSIEQSLLHLEDDLTKELCTNRIALAFAEGFVQGQKQALAILDKSLAKA